MQQAWGGAQGSAFPDMFPGYITAVGAWFSLYTAEF